MTTISQSLLDTVNGTSSTTSSSSSTSAKSISDKFLTLLVTQLKNQDPLNPTDNSQVTSQMAQLATVEDLEKVNTNLESLISSSTTSQTLAAANLIGHSALVEGNDITIDSSSDSSGGFGVELSKNTDNLTITISDSSGNTVKTYELGAQDAGTKTLSWDGTDSDGNTVDNGDYTFTVTATSGGEDTSPTALSLETISSITSSSSGVTYNLSNSTSVSSTDFKRVY